MKNLRNVAENVWEATAPLNLTGLRMDHRMTVLRLENGDVLVHSPVSFSRELANEIESIGSPVWFVAPSRYHDLFWPEWFQAFPKGRFVAAPGVKEDLRNLPFTDVLMDGTQLWDGEITALPLRGMPKLNEWVILHEKSRSLIVADLIFNFAPEMQNFFGRLFLKFNGIYGKPGISRMFRMFIKDRQALRDSLQEIQTHSFDRIILGHGPNLGGNAVLARAITDAGLQ